MNQSKHSRKTFQIDRLRLVRGIIGVAMLAQLFISQSLWWGSERMYPLTPMFGDTSLELPDGWQLVAFIGLLLATIGLVIIKNTRWSLGIFLVAMILFWVQDITRIQAWSYQYVVMLVIIMLGTWQRNAITPLAALQLVIISLYFWAGIQKINLHFATSVFPWMMEAYPALNAFGKKVWLGYSVAGVETLLGIGLFWQHIRRVAIVGAVIFHVIILLLLIGLSWNEVVYPWNIAMILLILSLFLEHSRFSQTARANWQSVFTILLGKNWTLGAVVLVFAVLPLFNLLGFAPDQLAQKMYSGDGKGSELHFSAKDFESCVPEALIKELEIGEAENEVIISLDDWAFERLKVPAFAGDAALQKTGLQFCECLVHSQEGFIVIYTYPKWNLQAKTRKLTCGELYRRETILNRE